MAGELVLTGRRLDIVESIKAELGHPVITLYVQDAQINKMIDKALLKCAPKSSPVYTVDCVVVNGSVDLNSYDVAAVKNIYSNDGSASSGSDNIFDIYSPGNSGSYNDLIYRLGQSSLNTAISMPDYYLDNGILTVDDYYGGVTVEYVKNMPSLEDLDSKWYGWVENYTVALTKMIEGRIRGKFKPQNAPFEVESDNLVQEGQTAIQDLDEKLNQAMGFYNVLR
jgi:hypothetical protein